MNWGVLLNYDPTHAELNELGKMMPKDKKWHTIFQQKDGIDFDNKFIRRKTADSMT